jgi:hypothetical protein
MGHRFAEVAFTESVKAAQERNRARVQNERLENLGGPNDEFGAAEAAFIAARDSFYMATVSETGWPYVQDSCRSSIRAPLPLPTSAGIDST